MEKGTLFPNRTSRPSYRPREERFERCRTTSAVVGVIPIAEEGGVGFRWDLGVDVVILARGDHGGEKEDEDAKEEKAAAADAAEFGTDRARIEEKDLGNIMVECCVCGGESSLCVTDGSPRFF